MNTKPTLFIAESDNLLIESIKERLRGCNIEVIGSTTEGTEVVKLVKQLHPDILVLNLVLSEKDGVQVLDELSQTYPNNDNMIIICTSFFTGHIVDICAQKGASYFIKKPYNLSHISDIIQLFANQHQYKRELLASDTYMGRYKCQSAPISVEDPSESTFSQEAPTLIDDDKMEDDATIDGRFDYSNKSIVLREILSRAGFNAGNKGFKYLTGSVLMVMAEYRRLERITVSVYPKIAENYDTNRAAVERGIRNLITRCWDKEDRKALFDKYFPNSFTERPSNKDVIELLARRMETHYADYEKMCKIHA